MLATGVDSGMAKVKRSATGATILDVAERLFAERGIEAVSLREIGIAAGSANNGAVQYHFGDKPQLVRAIFERHQPAIDNHRGLLLAAAEKLGLIHDPRVLIVALLRPLCEHRDEDGRRSYAAFLAGLVRLMSISELRSMSAGLVPHTERLLSLLRATLPHLSADLFEVRTSLMTIFVVHAIRNHDLVASPVPTGMTDDDAIDNIIAMASGAMMAEPKALSHG